jgi:hypothetical protein
MTCWALSSELGLAVKPRPSGQNGCVLEFAVETSRGKLSFEVKSPRLCCSARLGGARERPASVLSGYSVALAMRGALRAANRQFAPARPNILVIAMPEIETGAALIARENWSTCFIRAFYGEQCPRPVLSRVSGSEFVPEGNFLRWPGGVPRFTRISAVFGLEDSGCLPKLRAMVLHNPCSQRPVDPLIFSKWPQLSAVENAVRRLKHHSTTNIHPV